MSTREEIIAKHMKALAEELEAQTPPPRAREQICYPLDDGLFCCHADCRAVTDASADRMTVWGFGIGITPKLQEEAKERLAKWPDGYPIEDGWPTRTNWRGSVLVKPRRPE